MKDLSYLKKSAELEEYAYHVNDKISVIYWLNDLLNDTGELMYYDIKNLNSLLRRTLDEKQQRDAFN